jgi:hypothetical protein
LVPIIIPAEGAALDEGTVTTAEYQGAEFFDQPIPLIWIVVREIFHESTAENRLSDLAVCQPDSNVWGGRFGVNHIASGCRMAIRPVKPKHSPPSFLRVQ